MKKLLICAMLSVLITLTACSGKATETDTEALPSAKGESNASIPAEDSSKNPPISLNNGDEAVLLNEQFITENAVYALSTADNGRDVTVTEDGNFTIINSDDDSKGGYVLEAGNAPWDAFLPLCGRPECRHDNNECTAFFPCGYQGNIGKDTFVFVRDNSLYVFAGITLYKSDLSGKNRKTVLTLPDKYSVNRNQGFYYFQNKIYFEVTFGEYSEDTGQYVGFHDFIELDYIVGSYRIIRSVSDAEAGQLVGICGGNAYYRLDEYFDPRFAPPGGFDALSVRLFGVSLADGSTEILLDGVQFDYNNFALTSEKLIWHSRRSSNIMSMNLGTKQTAVIAGDIKGWIVLQALLDNRAVYSGGDGFFYIDSNSGEKGEFRGGNVEELSLVAEERGIIDWGEYFLVGLEWTRISRTHRVSKWGLIPKADFWNDDFDNMQIIGS